MLTFNVKCFVFVNSCSHVNGVEWANISNLNVSSIFNLANLNVSTINTSLITNFCCINSGLSQNLTFISNELKLSLNHNVCFLLNRHDGDFPTCKNVNDTAFRVRRYYGASEATNNTTLKIVTVYFSQPTGIGGPVTNTEVEGFGSASGTSIFAQNLSCDTVWTNNLTVDPATE